MNSITKKASDLAAGDLMLVDGVLLHLQAVALGAGTAAGAGDRQADSVILIFMGCWAHVLPDDEFQVAAEVV